MTEKELNQKKKDYLRSYKPIERRIRQIEEDIHKLQLEADASRAIQYSDMPKGSSNLQSPQEAYTIALEEAINKRTALKAEYVKKKEEIKQTIHSIHDEELEELLEYRYISEMPIRQIAKKIEYGTAQTNRLLSKALKEIKTEKMKDDTK